MYVRTHTGKWTATVNLTVSALWHAGEKGKQSSENAVREGRDLVKERLRGREAAVVLAELRSVG